MTNTVRVRLLAAVLAIGVIEAISQVGFWWVHRRGGILIEPAYGGALSPEQRSTIQNRIVEDRMEYTAFSPDLGWTVRRNGRSRLYTSNSLGIRSSREYDAAPSSSHIRVAAFGDSYTHGDDVANEDTWTRQLELRNPRFEVLNFGVGGFGTDQALLRYETEGRAVQPHVVLMCLRPENIYRVVSVFRPFYRPETGVPMAKPRFVLRGSELVLLPNPLPTREAYRALLENETDQLARLGDHDYFFQQSYRRRPGDAVASLRLGRFLFHQGRQLAARDRRVEIDGQYNKQSEAYQVLAAVFLKFRDSVRGTGARPVVVILPDRDDIERFQTQAKRRYAPLLDFFRLEGIEFVDLMEGFAATGGEREISTLFEAHYSPKGNGLVARLIDEFLTKTHR